MGVMDKLKTQATQFAERAQEAGKAGQAKIEAIQARRRADALCAELGRLTLRARTERSAPDDEGRMNDLVEQLRQYEAEYGTLDDAPEEEAPAAAPEEEPPAAAPEEEPPAGD